MAGPSSSSTPARVLAIIDRLIALVVGAGMALVLPVSLLLFLQWPLRDLVQAYSREANDLAQLLFALYVSVAITYASRRRTHLAADALAHRYSPATRTKLARAGALLILVPWSAFMLYASWPIVAQSVRQLEEFPETFNPGYFVIKGALFALVVLVLLQAFLDATGRSAAEMP
jgi:TRAP-type mannitol/chloroaromatic compound transport system permease small subunit